MKIYKKLSHGITRMCQSLYVYVEDQSRSCSDKDSRWKYDFDIDVKGHNHTEGMNQCDTSTHADTLMCLCQGTKKVWPENKANVKMPINLNWRSKVNMVLGSGMYARISSLIFNMWYVTDEAIRSFGSDTKTMSRNKKGLAQKQSNVKNHKKIYLSSKVSHIGNINASDTFNHCDRSMC